MSDCGTPCSFQYDRQGDMTCATPGISLPTTGACPSGSYSYTYDGNGLRASSTSPNGAISNFTYNLTSPSPQILTDSTNAYIYGPSGTPIGNAPLEQISISQPTQLPLYLLSGPSGVTNTFDSQGLVGTQSYDPWGNITSSNNMTTPFGYQGAYTDPTGFQYLINRYYDPSTGQFLSADPLVWKTGMPYSYALNDPINADDPWGLGFCIFGHNGNGGCNGGSLTHFKHILCDVYGASGDFVDITLGITITTGADLLASVCIYATEGACTPVALVTSEFGTVYGLGFIENGFENPNPNSCDARRSRKRCK